MKTNPATVIKQLTTRINKFCSSVYYVSIFSDLPLDGRKIDNHEIYEGALQHESDMGTVGCGQIPGNA